VQFICYLLRDNRFKKNKKIIYLISSQVSKRGRRC